MKSCFRLGIFKPFPSKPIFFFSWWHTCKMCFSKPLWVIKRFWEVRFSPCRTLYSVGTIRFAQSPMTSPRCKSSPETPSSGSSPDVMCAPWTTSSTPTNLKPLRSKSRLLTGPVRSWIYSTTGTRNRNNPSGHARTQDPVQWRIRCHHSSGATWPTPDSGFPLGIHLASCHDRTNHLHFCHRHLPSARQKKIQHPDPQHHRCQYKSSHHNQQPIQGLCLHQRRSQPTTTKPLGATMPFQSTSPSPRKHHHVQERTLKKGRDIGDHIFVNSVNI